MIKAAADAPARIETLLEKARNTARQMYAAAEGRDPAINVEMPLSLFTTIADMLEQLVQVAEGDRSGRAQVALKRIAGLDIRSAGELLELGAWKRITSQLQAIAQETLDGTALKPAEANPQPGRKRLNY